jgi:hypothetical protein
MPGLLIDRKFLVNHRIDKLLNISGFPPETKDDIGIIFLITKKQYKSLIKLSTGQEKIFYINSPCFVNSVYASYFIIYNKDKKICEIRGQVDDEHLIVILESLVKYLPNDVTVWSGLVPDNKMDFYIKSGFDNPYITDHSPLKHKFGHKGMVFSKPNMLKKSDKESVVNKLNNAFKQLGNICNMYARFTPKAISYLRNINDPNKKNQKELAGSLVVSKVIKKDGKIVFELSPDPTSIIHGDEEEVGAVLSRYNFHTHPKKAYDNHGVVRGWPSSQDFVGFLGLDNQTIFHTVVTLEGVYMISLSPEYTGKISDVDKKFVLSHYDINHETKISFNEYVKRINSKKYKRKQLFIIQYLSWNKSTKEFPIHYSKTKDKCLATEESFRMYKN